MAVFLVSNPHTITGITQDYGMSVQIYYCKNFDAQTQLANIEQALVEGANALVLVPINSPIISKKIRQLNKQNIPIVFLTTYLNRVSCFSSIHCDYFRSGRIGGMLIHRISYGQGNVMVFLPSNAMLGNNARRDGIETYFKTAPPSLNLVGIIELTNNPKLDELRMQKEFSEHPDVNHILYCGDSQTALSALEKTDRHITSIFYDLSPETKAGILDGRIDAAIVQSPKDQGYKSIDVLFQYWTSNKIPSKNIIMDSQIIFKESID